MEPIHTFQSRLLQNPLRYLLWNADRSIGPWHADYSNLFLYIGPLEFQEEVWTALPDCRTVLGLVSGPWTKGCIGPA